MSQVKCTKLAVLMRNMVAAFNTPDDKESIAVLEHTLTDPEHLVRTEAVRVLEAIRERQAQMRDASKRLQLIIL